MQRVFSGIQPSGIPTLGNYLGAIRNWVRLQDDHECLWCVVDMHAITVSQDPAALRQQSLEMAAVLLACGVDPVNHILFPQSGVRAHAQLAWIFNCVARLGWLNRMTQFKDKAGKDRETVSAGLYIYPNLMAADIHAYHATRVPVGDDQRSDQDLRVDRQRGSGGKSPTAGDGYLRSHVLHGRRTAGGNLGHGAAHDLHDQVGFHRGQVAGCGSEAHHLDRTVGALD